MANARTFFKPDPQVCPKGGKHHWVKRKPLKRKIPHLCIRPRFCKRCGATEVRDA